MINEAKVMLFSKFNDPYSNQVKHAFSKYEIPYSVIELDQVVNGQKILEELKELIAKPKTKTEN